MIYFLLATYLFILACRYDFGAAKSGREFHYWLAFLFMVGLVSLRYRVGGDTINYIYTFDNLTPELIAVKSFESERFQPIPAIIFAGCKTLFDNFIFVQAIFALFVNTVMFVFIKNNTQYRFTALFLFALTFFMRLNCEIMRESLAIAFFLLAYPNIFSKRYFRYYFFATLAFLCHSSAICIFILPFLKISNFKRAGVPLLAVSLVFLYLIIGNSSYLSSISSYLDLYSNYDSSLIGKITSILFNIMLPSIFLFLTRGFISDFIKLGVVFYILSSIFSLFFYIAFRFCNYVMIFYIIMVTEYIMYVWKRRETAYYKARVMLMTFFFLFSTMNSYFTDVSKYVGHQARWYCVWYPYYSIFNPQIDEDREQFILLQGSY